MDKTTKIMSWIFGVVLALTIVVGLSSVFSGSPQKTSSSQTTESMF